MDSFLSMRAGARQRSACRTVAAAATSDTYPGSSASPADSRNQGQRPAGASAPPQGDDYQPSTSSRPVEQRWSARGGNSQGPRPQRNRPQPFGKAYWRKPTQGWFLQPEFTPATLYEDIVRRCETGSCDEKPLFLMCQLATSPQEARIALTAFAAVRSSLVRKNLVAPFTTKLAVAFVDMICNADAPDVLVEALQRATELGLLLSPTRLHALLKHWGELGELAKIEQVLGAMPLGGVPYNHVTAYIVIRTAVNLGAQDKAEYYAAAMMQRQVRITDSAARLLELGRERQRQAAAAAAAGVASAVGPLEQ